MLSNKMLLLSAAAHDPTHPQEYLNNALSSSEFTIRSVVTRDCGILDNKCSGYIAISHKEKAIVVDFRGSDQMGQVLTQFVEGLVVPKTPFLGGDRDVQSYWKRAFDNLWECMRTEVKSSYMFVPLILSVRTRLNL